MEHRDKKTEVILKICPSTILRISIYITAEGAIKDLSGSVPNTHMIEQKL